MKKISNKIITKLIIIFMVFLILFNVLVPDFCYAEPSTGASQSSDDGGKEDWMGVLFEPIANAICGLGDGIINRLQGFMLPGSPTAVKKRSQAELLLGTDGFMGAVVKIDSFVAGLPFIGDWFTNSFANKFNGISNFITGAKNFITGGKDTAFNITGDDIQNMLKEMPYPLIFYSPGAIFSNKIPALDVNFINPSVKNPFLYNNDGSPKSDEEINKVIAQQAAENGIEYSFLNEQQNASNNNEVIQKLKDEVNLQMGKASKEYVDKLKEQAVKALGDNATEEQKEAKRKEIQQLDDEGLLGNTAKVLHSVIAKWYISIRNIAIVGLLIVLVYIGIRIMISSTADETAKYKMLLKEWVMALILVLCMHYLMLFILTIVDSLIKMLASSIDFSTGDTLMNTVRILAGKAAANDKLIEEMGYGIIYLVMVFYTAMFTWQYIKRVIYMAFLTIISPLVALTYPLDKIKDGKSQAFNMWFKEYVFNLMLQPVHLLLYIIFVNSAIELAVSNMIYALVAIGFLLQAEKFIKKMFDIQPQGGAGAGGFAAGAIVTSALSTLRNGSQKVTNAISTGDNKNNKKVRTVENMKELEKNNTVDLTEFDSEGGAEQQAGGSAEQQTEGGQTGRFNDDRDPAPGMMIPGSREEALARQSLERLRNRRNNGEINSSETDPFFFMGRDPAPGMIVPGSNEADRSRLNNPESTPELSQPTGGSEVIPSTTPETSIPTGSANPRRVRISKPRRVANGMKNALKGPSIKLLKGLGKGALKVSLGATAGIFAGSVGVAAGLASDDFENVAKLGLAGLTGGAVVGTQVAQQGINIANKATNAPSAIKEIKEKYKEGSMTEEEYKEHIRQTENKDTLKKLTKDLKKQYQPEEVVKKQEKAKALMDAGLSGETEIRKGIELMEMQEEGKTKQGNSIEKVSDPKKAAKRAVGVINMAKMFSEKDAASKPQEVEGYVNKKVKTEKGREAAMDLFYGMHNLRRNNS